jgi:hypothetical protein
LRDSNAGIDRMGGAKRRNNGQQENRDEIPHLPILNRAPGCERDIRPNKFNH